MSTTENNDSKLKNIKGSKDSLPENSEHFENEIRETLNGCFSWKGSAEKLWKSILPSTVSKAPWYVRGRRWIAAAAVFLLVLTFWNMPGLLPGPEKSVTEGGKESVTLTDLENNEDLPTVGSFDNLLGIFEKNAQRYNEQQIWMAESFAAPEEAVSFQVDSSLGDRSAAGNKSNDSGYSKTNVQVNGVDEADIVKTDGRYIYYVNDYKITIAKAMPASEIQVVNTIAINDFMPLELYLDGDLLVIIGGKTRQLTKPAYKKDAPDGDTDSSKTADTKPALIYRNYINLQETTSVLIYNVKDPSNAKLVRDFEIDGYYLSSRKVDSQLYLVTNRYVYYYADIKPHESKLVPHYRNDAGEDYKPVEYSNIKYFPGSKDTNYLMIAGFDLDNIDEQAQISAFLGSGHVIYASRSNLYITLTNWEYEDIEGSKDDDTVKKSREAETGRIMPEYKPPKVTTTIYKFALNKGKVSYSAKGEVPGSLLNQFSMDEYDNHFRIATTEGEVWRTDEFTSKNNVYILNKDMKIAGRLENIAPGERIYSVRFMGEKAYIVTFKTVDPLFVLNLKNPEKPEILGELKIPGYSDYLHPYDENHIIGFGMDTTEVDIKDEKGNVISSNALQMGMKIAMFDVSDVNNPIEKFKINIGDRGTYSDVLYNHKALMYSAEKNLMAFPVTVCEAKQKWYDQDRTIPNYGEMTFQGAYVINIDPEKGFSVEARLTHIEDMDTLYPMQLYDYKHYIERALYIDNAIYTLSGSMIMAHDMENGYEELGRCKIN